MPRVEIELNDGSKKIVEFETGFTDADVDEVAGQLNSQIKTPQPLKVDDSKYQADIDAAAKEAAAEYGGIPEKTETQTLTGGVTKRSYNPFPAIGRFVGDIGKGLAQGYSSIGVGLGKNITNKQLRPLFGKKPLSDEELDNAYGFLDDAPVSKTQKVSKFVGNTAPFLLLPEAKAVEGTGLMAKLINGGLTGGYQTGLASGVDSLANKGITKDLPKDIFLGGAIGGTFGLGLPLAFAGGGKALEMAANSPAGKKIKEFVSQKALPTLRETFENLKKKSTTQNEAAQKVTETVEEAATRPPTVQEAQNLKKAIKKSIKLDKLPETNKNEGYYVTHRRNGHYFREVADDLALELENTSRKVNEGIKKLAKEPEFMNSKEFAWLDEEITKQIEKLPTEAQEEFFNTWYKAQAKADNYIKLGTEFKPQGLEQSVLEAKGTPREVKQILKNDMPQYQVLHNNELTEQAVREVEGNFNNELSRLTGAKEFNALDYEKSRQITKRLFDEGRVEEAINLIDNVSENATKKGQAIQALSLWSNMTPEGAVFKAEKLLKEFNRKLPENKRIKLTDKQIQDIRQLQSDAINAATDEERTQGFARTAKYISELVPKSALTKLKAYRNISLLLNPKTLGRNVIGNALFNTVDTASKALAVPFDRAIGLVTKQKTRVLPQVKDLGQGFIKGAKTGYKEALEGIDTRGLGQRFDLEGGRTFQSPFMQNLETALDIGLRVPDRAQYEATFAESVANMMKAQGLEKPTQEILEQAEKEALESVFQNDTALSNTILGLRKGMNKIGTEQFGLGDLFIPYAQTPANLTQQAINYSPLGAIKGIGNLVQGNQRQASLDLARSAIGTGIIGGGYALGKNGIASPAQYSENPTENKLIKGNLQPLGERPSSINGVWYAPFQPVSTNVAAGVAMANGENPLQAATNTIVDTPFLQSSTRALKDLQEKGIAEAGLNFLSSVPSQFVPTLLSQITQVFDPYQRETYDSNKGIQGLKQAQGKTPASVLLPAKRDVTGQPIKRYETEGARKLFDIFINPTFINRKTNDTVLSELKSLYNTTGETKHFMPIVDKKFEITNADGQKEKIELNGRQYTEFQKEVGQAMYSLADAAIKDEQYQNMNETERIEYMQKLKQAATQAAKVKLFGHNISKNTRKDVRNYADYILENHDDLVGE